MPWKPGTSPVATNVLKPGTPTRAPAAESVALPALGSANPLVHSRDIAIGGVSFSTQIGNSLSPWTPVLSFGGGTTGITYSQQIGFAFNLAKLGVALFEIVLTSKGSSTGVAQISGLPTTALTITPAPVINFSQGGFPFSYANMTATTNTFIAGVQGGTAVIQLFKIGNGTASNIAMVDTDFTNTSQIGGLVIYLTN